MKFKNYDLVFGPNLGSNQASAVEDLNQDVGFSMQVTINGTALSGTLKLQCSNDNVNFADIPSTSQALSALTGVSTYVYNIDATYYQYVRAFWTYTSGAGTVTVCKVTVKSC